ncbi:MAG: hypothetical protein ACYCSO_07675 [Cuniculiplasma sp.]
MIVRSFSRFIPILILLMLMGASVTLIYGTGNKVDIKANDLSFIPKNSVAISYMNNTNMDIFLFHTHSQSGAIFYSKQMSQAIIVPPVIKVNSTFSLQRVDCYRGIPIFKISITSNNKSEISGLDRLILGNIGINTNDIIFSSPVPGVMVVGSMGGVICSLNSSFYRGSDKLLSDLNMSDKISFAYSVNSSNVKMISGNASGSILTSVITMKNIGLAVDLALSLQYILGDGYVILPVFDKVIIVTSASNNFLFLQYNLLKMILMDGGVTL